MEKLIMNQLKKLNIMSIAFSILFSLFLIFGDIKMPFFMMALFFLVLSLTIKTIIKIIY